MKVKAITDYNDLILKKLIKKGEELDVTEERGKTLLTAKVVKVVDTPATGAGNDDAASSSSSSAKKRGKKKES